MELIEKYHRLVCKIATQEHRKATYMAPVIGLDDLIQAGRIGLWKAGQTHDSDYPFIAYAAAKIRFAIRDEIRRWMPFGRNGPIDAVYEYDPVYHDVPQHDPDPTHDQIRAALTRLPVCQQVVVELKLLGYNNAEIARRIGSTTGSVATTNDRAVKRLRGHIGGC